eukprot:3431187-Pyramimonas_sp.AAC.1
MMFPPWGLTNKWSTSAWDLWMRPGSCSDSAAAVRTGNLWPVFLSWLTNLTVKVACGPKAPTKCRASAMARSRRPMETPAAIKERIARETA